MTSFHSLAKSRPRLTPEFGGWLSLICCAPFLINIPVTNDSAWQLWLGRQMLHGVNLYTDLIEVNPPLWFWISVPLAWVAEALALPSRVVLIGFLLLAITLSYGFCVALIRDWPARQRFAFTIGFLLVTIPISLRIFTQREHFVLASTIPYILLCSARDERRMVAPGLALAIGTLAAFGFAIKPFFAVVPIALELWLWRRAPVVRPETACIGMLAVLYVIAVLLFERDFVASVPMIASAYEHFTGGRYQGFVTAFLLFALAIYPLAHITSRSAAFLVAGLAFLLAFAMQGKGWSYQALPAIGMLILALSVSQWGRSAVRDAFATSVFVTTLWLNAQLYPTARSYRFPANSAVATLTVGTLPVWPQVEERGYLWPLHTFSLWQLAAIEKRLLPAEPLQRRLARDLRCHPPTYILVDQSPAVQDFLQRSGDLTEILSHFTSISSRDGLTLYKRSAPLRARPSACREIYPSRLTN